MHAIAAIARLVLDVRVPARNDLQGSLTVHGRDWRATDQSPRQSRSRHSNRPNPSAAIARPGASADRRSRKPVLGLRLATAATSPQGHLPEFLQPTTRARDRSRRLAERGDPSGVGLERGVGVSAGPFPEAARPNRTCPFPSIRLSTGSCRLGAATRRCPGGGDHVSALVPGDGDRGRVAQGELSIGDRPPAAHETAAELDPRSALCTDPHCRICSSGLWSDSAACSSADRSGRRRRTFGRTERLWSIHPVRR
jgi:hypothetical protein